MKNLLLAKSNIRKSKGLSICISLLILIGSMFICVSSLLVYDYQKNGMDVAKRLDTTDVEIYSFGNAAIATAFIQGLSLEDLPNKGLLKFNDPQYSICIGIVARK